MNVAPDHSFAAKKTLMENLRLKDKLVELERKIAQRHADEKVMASLVFELKSERRELEDRVGQQEERIEALQEQVSSLTSKLEEQVLESAFLQACLTEEQEKNLEHDTSATEEDAATEEETPLEGEEEGETKVSVGWS
jgi:chromosome segregation ATPase